MNENPVIGLRHQAELLGVLSLSHLDATSRTLLAQDQLSVNAYPASCGGLVHVGLPRYRVPAEHDLAQVFEVAEAASVSWLFFDANAAVIDGLPTYPAADPVASPPRPSNGA